MAKVELVHTAGPFGDCTSNYDVVTDAKTLGEFLDAAIGRDNYETFCLRAGKGYDDDVCLAKAENGVVVRKASQYDSLLSLKFKKAKANGGWGQMGYDIWVEGEFPKQDRQEFEMVFWGHTFKH